MGLEEEKRGWRREMRGEGDPDPGRWKFEMSTEFFLVPSSTSSSSLLPQSSLRPLGDQTDNDSRSGGEVGIDEVVLHPPPIQLLRAESWVLPLLVFSTLTMTLIILFEVFVVIKTRGKSAPSRRHLFLGQMLLLGLFLCTATSAFLTAQPTPFICASIRFGAGLSYALVFAALLVKCVFLISLNSGVYLPAPYQALLLFFAVLIQAAVGLQWLLNTPPRVIIQASGRKSCSVSYHQILASLVYAIFLLGAVGILAIKSRGIRENYREAAFIGLATASVLPVSIGWALCGLVVLERNREACLGFGLSGTALVVFLVMFTPKGRQLAALGRGGASLSTPMGGYDMDKASSSSSISRPASPSFFHFKPAKPPLNTFDRVALVAPPPSYGHHYYPYCYYPRVVGGGRVDGSIYTTVEPTLSSNPNVFFHRGVHSGLMY